MKVIDKLISFRFGKGVWNIQWVFFWELYDWKLCYLHVHYVYVLKRILSEQSYGVSYLIIDFEAYHTSWHLPTFCG